MRLYCTTVAAPAVPYWILAAMAIVPLLLTVTGTTAGIWWLRTAGVASVLPCVIGFMVICAIDSAWPAFIGSALVLASVVTVFASRYRGLTSKKTCNTLRL